MTAVREGLHRWAVLFTVAVTLTAAAMRSHRRAKQRRKFWRKVEAWPW
jgi:hypothetical protein